MSTGNQWHSLIEIEGKSLQEDVAVALEYLYRKYPNKPTKCRVPISAKINAKVDYGIPLEISRLVNSKNLEFCYDDDPRKSNIIEEIIEETIMVKQGRLTDPQVKVIEKLEAVLAECAEAGIVLIGMDNNLLAYNWSKLEKAGYNDDPLTAQQKLDQGYPVREIGVYLDSGGW